MNGVKEDTTQEDGRDSRKKTNKREEVPKKRKQGRNRQV